MTYQEAMAELNRQMMESAKAEAVRAEWEKNDEDMIK